MSKLVYPTKKPIEFKDHPKYRWDSKSTHVIVNDESETAKAYSADGKLLWKVPCLARGIYGPDWRIRNADTPPGLYTLGEVYRDYKLYGDRPAYDRTLIAYGWFSFDMIDLENQETGIGRAGIMIHGGGSNNGWPGAWAPHQKLWPTHGCVRMHNEDLFKYLLPRYDLGRVFVSVIQDAP